MSKKQTAKKQTAKKQPADKQTAVEQTAVEQPAGKQPAGWKAKCDCTYNGVYVRAGEIVLADKMDNPYFEKAV